MLIKDVKLIQAISSISQRAERQRDINKVINSYVEIGILPQLLNNNNQILYGRRGTGKTHILRIYENFYKDFPMLWVFRLMLENSSPREEN